MVSTVPIPARTVAIVTPHYATSRGGIERYVERLAVGMANRGVAVEVISLDRQSAAATSELRDGVIIHRLRLSGVRDAGGQSTSLTAWLMANAERFSVLNAHNLHTVLPTLTCIVARRARVPFVLTGFWHGAGQSFARQLMHIPYRPIAMWTARSADAVIYSSTSERALLERQLGVHDRLAFIPAGTDEVARGRPSGRRPNTDPDGVADKHTILSVGRLSPHKGTEALVRALPHLPPHYRLVIVGDGPARKAIEDAAVDGGVVDRVVLRGTCPDEELRDWYARAAVCVSLSAQESFGLVVLEAAAAGCPVVVSDIPAHRDLQAFVPSRRLFFIARDAAPVAVARLVQEATRAGRLPSARRSAADGWRLPTWDGLVDETLQVFSRVTRGERSSAQ